MCVIIIMGKPGADFLFYSLCFGLLSVHVVLRCFCTADFLDLIALVTLFGFLVMPADFYSFASFSY